MEQNSAFDSFELQLTDQAKSFLKEIGKWAMFLSIVGFIFMGLFVLLALLMFSMGSAMGSIGGAGIGAFGAAGGLVYLIMALIYFFPIRYLYMFASKIKAAFNNSNSQQMTDALENLKSHYKYIGIMMIIVLSFYALAIVIGIVAAIGAASM